MFLNFNKIICIEWLIRYINSLFYYIILTFCGGGIIFFTTCNLCSPPPIEINSITIKRIMNKTIELSIIHILIYKICFLFPVVHYTIRDKNSIIYILARSVFIRQNTFSVSMQLFHAVPSIR